MGRNKPWFGPIPSIGKWFFPVSWEGYAVTGAFALGVALLAFVDDPIRRAIAIALLAAAFGAVVFLTWRRPDAEVRRDWRETLWNRRARTWLVWLVLLLALMAAIAAADSFRCAGCYGKPGIWTARWHGWGNGGRAP